MDSTQVFNERRMMRKRPLLWFACVFLTGLAYEKYKKIEWILLPVCLLLQESYIYLRLYEHRYN